MPYGLKAQVSPKGTRSLDSSLTCASCLGARSARSRRRHYHHGSTGQGCCRGTRVRLCLDNAAPLPRTSCRLEEVFTARHRIVSVPDLSALHLRVSPLSLIGSCRSPRRAAVQPDAGIRPNLRGSQPRCNRAWDEELVHRKVWLR